MHATVITITKNIFIVRNNKTILADVLECLLALTLALMADALVTLNTIETDVNLGLVENFAFRSRCACAHNIMRSMEPPRCPRF